MAIKTIIECDDCSTELDGDDFYTKCEECEKILCENHFYTLAPPEHSILSSSQNRTLCKNCFEKEKALQEKDEKNFVILKNSIVPCKLCKTQPVVKYNLACKSKIHFTCEKCGYQISTLDYPSFYQGVRSWNSMQD